MNDAAREPPLDAPDLFVEGDGLPPHSPEAEQSVLGALLIGALHSAELRDVLGAEDFYAGAHREIFEAIEQCFELDKRADVITVAEVLRRTGKLDYVGGLSYIGSLAANVPTAAGVLVYAKIVRDRAILRRLAANAQRVHERAMNPSGDSAEEIYQEAREAFQFPSAFGWKYPDAIDESEWTSAHLTPSCIVEDYLYADVATLIAPGGTGKTTLILFEAVHVVLGRDLYGLAVRKPGPVLILTAEDSREMLVARLRAICDALDLTVDETATVRRDVRISDLCGAGFKLTIVRDDVVLPSRALNNIIDQAGTFFGERSFSTPVLVSIDPAVSFGVGEARVNDAEQGLIEAARKLRRELGCCVRYVHHSGKQNARDKMVDQYAGRGGSAMPDGARMVAVLQPLNADEWLTATGARLLDGEQGMLLARPKLSYRPPQPDILISRKGYAFAHTTRTTRTKAEELELNCAQIAQVLRAGLEAGRRHTQNSLQALDLRLSRTEIRDAVHTLIARGLIESAEVPERHKGGPQTYLLPQGTPNAGSAP